MGAELKLVVSEKGLLGMGEALRLAPKQLLENLAVAFDQIGRADIEEVRSTSKLRIQAAARKAFRYKATDPARATDGTKIFADEYSKWKAAGVHETGAHIVAKRGALWVLTAAAKGASGRRRWTDEQIKSFIESGKFKIIKVGRGWGSSRLAVIRFLDNKQTRFETIAFMHKAVDVPKRLDWAGVIRRNAPQHQAFIQAAIDKTIAEALGGHNDSI